MPAIRNGLILVAVATLFTFWGEGFNATNTAINQLALLALVVGVAVIAYRYFAQNQLRWLVIKRPLRMVVLACAGAIVLLITVGPWLFVPPLSLGAIWALAGALGLVIAWIVMQSRKD